jgi:hypothetical protein
LSLTETAVAGDAPLHPQHRLECAGKRSSLAERDGQMMKLRQKISVASGPEARSEVDRLRGEVTDLTARADRACGRQFI